MIDFLYAHIGWLIFAVWFIVLWVVTSRIQSARKKILDYLRENKHERFLEITTDGGRYAPFWRRDRKFTEYVNSDTDGDDHTLSEYKAACRKSSKQHDALANLPILIAVLGLCFATLDVGWSFITDWVAKHF